MGNVFYLFSGLSSLGSSSASRFDNNDNTKSVYPSHFDRRLSQFEIDQLVKLLLARREFYLKNN